MYHARHVYTTLPIVHASLILILVLQFLFNLSGRKSYVVLAGLHDILRRANVPPEQLEHIPRDSRTVLQKFRLDPFTVTYVMCPQCYALYPLTITEETCIHKPTEQSDPCSAPILKLIRKTTRDRSQDHISSGSEADGCQGHSIPTALSAKATP